MRFHRFLVWNRLARLLALSALALLLLAACARQSRPQPVQHVLGGDARRGQVVFTEYGCIACHTIPGVTGADATVGPPLSGWAKRAYIAGRLPNTPENLVTWIMSPQAVDPGNAMPDVGVPEVVARDMAAYLFTLQDDSRR